MSKSNNKSESIRELDIHDEESKDNMMMVENGNSQAAFSSEREDTSIQDNSQQIGLQNSADFPRKMKKI